jgi:hypothetical protein
MFCQNYAHLPIASQWAKLFFEQLLSPIQLLLETALVWSSNEMSKINEKDQK